jgi:hypothetical protein
MSAQAIDNCLYAAPSWSIPYTFASRGTGNLHHGTPIFKYYMEAGPFLREYKT